MEDMARLALVEESVRDIDKYQKILYELLRHINNILENPHDYQLRTIKSNILKEVTNFKSFNEYLQYVGFEQRGDNFVYPNQSTLSNLRMAQGALERKINFCFGAIDNNKSRIKTVRSHPSIPRMNLLPVNVLATHNPFLRKIQELFNNVLVYEEAELQVLAREHIPLASLQLMALDRVREQQKEIKTGKIKALDLPFDIALLMELISWFKHEFFSWVDQPPCEACAGPTTFTRTETMTTAVETCRVEIFKCTQCGGGARFPRHNDLRTLLRTRSGRCGEWANCFTLLCRALGYDARYVYDTTDHVWCEVFDFDSNTWLHCDPCEAKLNTPLMYCHGWGKKLSYVIAVSRDDVQDVTWRYTTNHKEVVSRRTACGEGELIESLVTLRGARQRQVTEARRRYLARRTLQELVQMILERKPSDYESLGRISGSAAWRSQRGESGATQQYTFTLDQPGHYAIRYYGASDKYIVSRDQTPITSIAGWRGGVFHSDNMIRKVEQDWKMVYLARTEGASRGSISWRVHTGACAGAAVSARLGAARYHAGAHSATLRCDQKAQREISLDDPPVEIKTSFNTLCIEVELWGGEGDVSWQHSQLARQSLTDPSPALEILITVEPGEQ